ncbi:MAG: hypothetical protein JW763_03660 [candidate division Zixibacteria bacterium]|nr:hypothetical protein [candidate division Zixibacteria bacterium]
MRSYITLALVVLFIIPTIAFSIDLREIGDGITLTPDSHVAGMTSGQLVVTDKHAITFFNRRLGEQKTIPIGSKQRAIVAPDGRSYALITSSASDILLPESNTVEVFDSRGRLQWSLNAVPDGEMRLAPGGSCLLVMTGTPGSWDWRMLVCQADSLASLVFIEAFKGVVFAPDARRFLVDCNPKGLRLFASSGEEIANYGLQHDFCFTDSSDRAVMCYQGELQVWRDSTRVYQTRLQETVINTLVASDTANRIVVASNTNMEVLDLATGAHLWNYRVPTAQMSFVSLDISDDGKFIACGISYNRGPSVEKTERYQEDYLYLFDIDRNIMRKKEFSLEHWQAGHPQVAFWIDRRSILVRNLDKIHVVEMH